MLFEVLKTVTLAGVQYGPGEVVALSWGTRVSVLLREGYVAPVRLGPPEVEAMR